MITAHQIGYLIADRNTPECEVKLLFFPFMTFYICKVKLRTFVQTLVLVQASEWTASSSRVNDWAPAEAQRSAV